jgi:serine/threonine protein kinase
MSVAIQMGDVLLNRYQITGLLGEGGVGVVYEALDTRLNRPVAVKVLRKSALRTRTAAQRLLREARTLASVSHPHLVMLLDYELLPSGVPALVMERIQGLAASEWMTHRPFTVFEAISVVHQSLGALAACHDAGIIHRDLKPSNILIEQRPDGRPYAKVIDFGIVRLNTDDMATALTLAGEIFGSPRYMAPEQWTQAPVDARTDVYAMGLIAYVLLAGEHFIKVTNPVQVFEGHMTATRPTLEVTAGGERVPPIVANAIRRAMHPDPTQRFEDCDAFKHALDPLLTPSGSYAMPDAAYFENALAEAEAEAAAVEAAIANDATILDTGDLAARIAVITGQHPPAPKDVGDHRLGFDGEEHTSITKGDFNRAMASNPTPGPSASVFVADQRAEAPTLASPAVPKHLSTLPSMAPVRPAELVPNLWRRVFRRLFFWKP